jgi:hypothetical protein
MEKRPKLILHFFAGLGNQQFQYAVAKLLAEKYNRELVLDDSYFLKRYHPIKNQGGYFSNGLQHYALPEKKVLYMQRELLGLLNIRAKVQALYRRLSFHAHVLPRLLLQSDEDEEAVLKGKKTVILFGYFQAHSILKSKYSELSSIFRPKFNVSSENKVYLAKAEQNGSVSMHVRRGDYLKIATYKELGPEYYEAGLREIKKRVKVTSILIFSDDIGWAKRNFQFEEEVIYVESKGPDYEHQYIMRKCAHNVTANSTFSWWAACMNKNKNKIICTPEKWFKGCDAKGEIYIPPEWIQL